MNSQNVEAAKETQKPMLNPLYTFENFVEGDSNNFAFLAAKSVSINPEVLYNLLIIQGEIGSGTTHLMQAVGNVMMAQGKAVIYTSVEQFLNDFSHHLSNRTMDRFKDKYRKCDLLLIDGIQFLSGKNQIQEEFFHTFEVLLNENKQIVMTSDKHPKQITGLNEGLKSQILSGLEVNVLPQELETKKGIIKKKCNINHLKLDNEMIHYIATTIEGNTHEIVGIITKLSAYFQLLKVDITVEIVRNVVESQILLK